MLERFIDWITNLFKINVKEIERKLMKYFTPNTTKTFDDVVNDFNNL